MSSSAHSTTSHLNGSAIPTNSSEENPRSLGRGEHTTASLNCKADDIYDDGALTRGTKINNCSAETSISGLQSVAVNSGVSLRGRTRAVHTSSLGRRRPIRRPTSSSPSTNVTSTSPARIHTWDPISNKRIAKIDPRIQQRVADFINAAQKHGIKLRVAQGFRSFHAQNNLYAKGRTRAQLDAKGLQHIKARPNEMRVTNAIGGHSGHNWGLAIDVVPIVNGQADWDGPWHKIASIGKKAGLKWGGDWQSFVDKPHFYVNLQKNPHFSKKE